MTGRSWEMLEGLDPGDVEAILGLSTTLSMKQGERLFDLGDDATHVFFVDSGRIRLTLPLSVGDRRVDAMVGERIPGHLVGWSGLIPPHKFTVMAVASESSRIVSLPREALLAYFMTHPEAGFMAYSNLARIVGQRLQVFQTLWIREMQHVVKSKTS